MKKKVALMLPSLRGGGAERVTVLLANGLAEKGIDVDLVVCKSGGVYQSEVNHAVNIVDLDVSRVAFSIIPIMKYLTRVKPHAAVSAMGHLNVATIIAKLFCRSKAKLLVVEHNSLSKEAKGRKVGAHILFLMRALYPFADEVAAVSARAADDLSNALRLKTGRVKVLYNPVVSNSIIQKAAMRVEEEWFEDSDIPIFLAIGRLTPQKDFLTLVRAFHLVCKTHPSRLIILGEGEMRGEIQEQIDKLQLSDSVKMPGFVENPFAYLKQSNAFVLSSRWEGLPTALIEAMACGTPVIATDCPAGPAEILENGRWGRLVPVGDENLLATGMIETITARHRRDVEKRARAFDVETSVDAYLRLLSIKE